MERPFPPIRPVSIPQTTSPKRPNPGDIARLILVMSSRTLDDKFLDRLSRGLDRDVGSDPATSMELLLYGLAPFNLALAETAPPDLREILEALEAESLEVSHGVFGRFGGPPHTPRTWRVLFRTRLGEYFAAATASTAPGMPIAKHPLTEIGRIAASHFAPGAGAFPDTKALIGSHFASAHRYARDVLADNGMPSRPPGRDSTQ